MMDYYLAHAPAWHDTARFFLNLSALLGVAYLVHRYMLSGMLAAFCVPRTPHGLMGIFLGPWLHVNMEHLLFNAVSLVFLGWLIMLHGQNAFLGITVVIWLVDGVGVWLLGRGNIPTVGASGIVYGYIAFLIAFGVYAGDWLSIFLGTVAVLGHTTAVANLTRLQPGVSLISHWAGFVGGMIAAHWFWISDTISPGASL